MDPKLSENKNRIDDAAEVHKQTGAFSVSSAKFQALRSPEGQILLLGCTLTLLYVVWLGGHAVWEQERFHGLFGMTITHVLFGRAAGLSFGYTLGLAHWLVILANSIIETIVVMLFYPLFVFSWKHLVEIAFLKRLMERTRQAAEADHPFIRKYGIVGLLAFVWLPFWMTGPVIGCVIGFLLHLRPWLNLAIVLSGTYLAILSWALLLRELYERIEAYSVYAPPLVFGIIIIIVIVGHLVRHKRSQ
jgi:uncharacterized membrane protein